VAVVLIRFRGVCFVFVFRAECEAGWSDWDTVAWNPHNGMPRSHLTNLRRPTWMHAISSAMLPWFRF
jgi:hypothetical protein